MVVPLRDILNDVRPICQFHIAQEAGLPVRNIQVNIKEHYFHVIYMSVYLETPWRNNSQRWN